MGDNSIIGLLKRYFRRFELRKQKAVWLAFGVDYEAEKEKQEAIWQQFQEKQRRRKRGGRGGRGPILIIPDIPLFLNILEEIDTQVKRKEAVEKLESLAEAAHCYMEKAEDTKEKLKWARVEAYIYQTINGILKAYDDAQIKQDIARIKKTIREILGDEGSGNPREG